MKAGEQALEKNRDTGNGQHPREDIDHRPSVNRVGGKGLFLFIVQVVPDDEMENGKRPDQKGKAHDGKHSQQKRRSLRCLSHRTIGGNHEYGDGLSAVRFPEITLILHIAHRQVRLARRGAGLRLAAEGLLPDFRGAVEHFRRNAEVLRRMIRGKILRSVDRLGKGQILFVIQEKFKNVDALSVFKRPNGTRALVQDIMENAALFSVLPVQKTGVVGESTVIDDIGFSVLRLCRKPALFRAELLLIDPKTGRHVFARRRRTVHPVNHCLILPGEIAPDPAALRLSRQRVYRLPVQLNRVDHIVDGVFFDNSLLRGLLFQYLRDLVDIRAMLRRAFSAGERGVPGKLYAIEQ